MNFPKRPSSHVTGDRAIQMFKDACEPAWIISNVNPDYGLDLRIEFTEKGEVSGQEIYVQVKGSARAVKQNPTVEIRQATINYWLAKLTPVLVVLVDTTANLIWYDWLSNAYSAYPKQLNTDKTVALILSKITTNAPLSKEIPRYTARFFGQLGMTTNNLSQRARLTEMLFHVVNLTHLFYGVWFYIGDITKKSNNTEVIMEKLRLFYQEFGTHDIFLQVPWCHFASSADSSPVVLEAFASRFSAYEEIKKTFFAPGPIQHKYGTIPLVGGGHEPSGTLQFVPLRLEKLILAVGPSIDILKDIEGLIFRILLLGRITFETEKIKQQCPTSIWPSKVKKKTTPIRPERVKSKIRP